MCHPQFAAHSVMPHNIIMYIYEVAPYTGTKAACRGGAPQASYMTNEVAVLDGIETAITISPRKRATISHAFSKE